MRYEYKSALIVTPSQPLSDGNWVFSLRTIASLKTSVVRTTVFSVGNWDATWTASTSTQKAGAHPDLDVDITAPQAEREGQVLLVGRSACSFAPNRPVGFTINTMSISNRPTMLASVPSMVTQGIHEGIEDAKHGAFQETMMMMKAVMDDRAPHFASWRDEGSGERAGDAGKSDP